MESTQEASMNHILNNCKQILIHIKESSKNSYDWKSEIKDCIEEIVIEADSWKEKKLKE